MCAYVRARACVPASAGACFMCASMCGRVRVRSRSRSRSQRWSQHSSWLVKLRFCLQNRDRIWSLHRARSQSRSQSRTPQRLSSYAKVKPVLQIGVGIRRGSIKVGLRSRSWTSVGVHTVSLLAKLLFRSRNQRQSRSQLSEVESASSSKSESQSESASAACRSVGFGFRLELEEGSASGFAVGSGVRSGVRD